MEVINFDITWEHVVNLRMLLARFRKFAKWHVAGSAGLTTINEAIAGSAGLTTINEAITCSLVA